MDDREKAAYAEQKRQEKQQYNQDLKQAMLVMAQDKEKFRIYLEVQGRLPSFSVGNTLMIATQYPNARQVRLSTEWADIGVRPLRSTKGIAILVPGSPYPRQDGSMAQGYDVRRAFDISQTSAAAHEKSAPRPSNTTLLRGLLDYQKGAWLYETVPEGADAQYDPQRHVITIRRQQQFAPLFCALAQEIVCADLLMRKNLHREAAAPVAACVTWMLCSRYRIEPCGVEIPEPKIIMGADSNNYRKCLEEIVSPMRSISNFMDTVISKAAKQKEAAL